MKNPDFCAVATFFENTRKQWSEMKYVRGHVRSVSEETRVDAWTLQINLWGPPDADGKAWVWGYFLMPEAATEFKDEQEIALLYGANELCAHLERQPMPLMPPLIDTDFLNESGPVRKVPPYLDSKGYPKDYVISRIIRLPS